MRRIYLLLTRTNTVMSKCVYAFTGGAFTHVALSLDDRFETLYSFGRKNPRMLLPAGFVKESILSGVMGRSDDINCAVLSMDITNASHQRLVQILDGMEAEMDIYRYNILGIPMCFFSIEKERHRHFFCSQFVSSVLIRAGAIEIEKAPSLMRPMDFLRLPGVKQEFSGTISQLRSMRLSGSVL